MNDSKRCYVPQRTFDDMNENMNRLIDVLNHRVTKLEMSVKWIRWIIGYIAVLVTAMVGKVIFF